MPLTHPLEFSNKLELELENILDYWKKNTLDHEFGGFLGRIDHKNHVIEKAPKGVILNTRLLWTFSKANNFYADKRFDEECNRAFEYLYENFRDECFGGVYWEVDHTGKPTNKRKQIYAQAFSIYALAEYYKYSKNKKAIDWAMGLFDLLEKRALDRKYYGYIEAFDEQWEPIQDLRLSEKDLNAPKTTNTHLHVLEAYTTLFEVTKDQNVRKSLEHLIQLFIDRIFDDTNHLKLFFTMDWEVLTSEISFGHDIEAAWLLNYGAKILKDPSFLNETNSLLIKISNTFIAEALDTDFGVFNAIDPKLKKLDRDKHWWPQAEAMVGMAYAWKITLKDTYLNIGYQVWEFINKHIIDHENGEWFFRVDAKGVPYITEDKVGPWKCPYHNSRALIEIITILKEAQSVHRNT